MAEIEYYKDDLFLTPSRIMAHGCNAYGLMGAGIAKYIRDTYPNVYETYREEFESNGLSPGQVVPAYTMETEDGGRIILNLITQVEPGPHAKYEYIQMALQKAVEYCEKLGEYTLSIPAIGCGIGGMDSIFLHEIIDNLDTPVKIMVFIPEG